MRLAIAALLAAVLSVLGASPGAAQAVLPGLWVSEDGEVSLHLRPENTYTLTGSLLADSVSGRYVVPGSGEMIVIRGGVIQGSAQIRIVEASPELLILASDEILGGRVVFEPGVPVSRFLAAPLGVFIGLTLILFGGGAVMTGRALGAGWDYWWKAIPYSVLLGAGDRFLIYGLFNGNLFSLWGFVLHTGILLAITLVTYRVARARAMVNQYPWLYERSSPFTWRERARPT